jgi:hypothetical protein
MAPKKNLGKHLNEDPSEFHKHLINMSVDDTELLIVEDQMLRIQLHADRRKKEEERKLREAEEKKRLEEQKKKEAEKVRKQAEKERKEVEKKKRAWDGAEESEETAEERPKKKKKAQAGENNPKVHYCLGVPLVLTPSVCSVIGVRSTGFCASPRLRPAKAAPVSRATRRRRVAACLAQTPPGQRSPGLSRDSRTPWGSTLLHSSSTGSG